MSSYTPAQSTIRRWRQNPIDQVRECFQAEPDAWQADVLMAFADPLKPRISLQACAGPGKTAVESWCGWNFLSCYGSRGEHPKGAAVSITSDNLKDNLWPEFAKWQSRSPYLSSAFTWNKERIVANDHPATWFFSARSWPKSASPDEQGKTLSGLHSKYLCYLIDESGAIPSTVLRAAEQGLSNCVFGKVLQGGNPISLEGMLHAAATMLAHQWYLVRVTGDPDDPRAWVHSPRLAALHKGEVGCSCPKCWARQQIQTYGRENPWVKAYILGQFPPSSLNALLGEAEVRQAQARALEPSAYVWAQARLGVDVARYGDDRTVIFPRQGKRAFAPLVMRHARDTSVSIDIATAVMRERAKFASLPTYGRPPIIMDATGGWAAGASDVLRAGDPEYPPFNVQFHTTGLDQRYVNRRAEMWFGMAEWVKAGGWLPQIEELVAELTTPTYLFNGGKFQIEDKKQVKVRLGRSPDLADSLALTFGLPEIMPAIAPAGDEYDGRASSTWG